MKLHFIPLNKGTTPMPVSAGDPEAVRGHAANLLRNARARGDKPRPAGPRHTWRLSNGLLRICF
jgi:hypothetical protein